MAASKKAKKTPAKASPKKVVKQAEEDILAQLEALSEPEESTTLDTLYIIDGSINEVTLEITVQGEGQTSDMTVKLESEVIAKEHAGDLPKKGLGTNKSLNGKKLHIVATIADTSRQTNFTGIKILLNGGVAPVELPLFKTVDEEGQSADYLCLIEFFKP